MKQWTAWDSYFPSTHILGKTESPEGNVSAEAAFAQYMKDSFQETEELRMGVGKGWVEMHYKAWLDFLVVHISCFLCECVQTPRIQTSPSFCITVPIHAC